MKNPSHSRSTPRSDSLRRVAAAVLLALCSVSVLAQLDPKASRFYEDALTRYEKKDYAGAVVQLKNALKVDNKSIAVQALMGKALLANSEPIAASVAFEEALRLGVNRAEVVVPLANAMLTQAKPQPLLDDPKFAEAGLPAGVQTALLLLKAQAAGDVGDTRSAFRFIEAARAIDPANPGSFLAEVPLRLLARQINEAAAAADKALALSPNSVEALYKRGSIAHLLGDSKTALAFYDKALAAEPTYTEGLVSRAGLMMDLGRLADAQRDVTELRKSSTVDPRGAYLAALLAERAGDATAMRKALNEVTALLDPVPIEFLRYKSQLLMLGGLSHYGLKQTEKARPYLEAALRSQPNSPVAKVLAEIYLSEKNIDRAIEALTNYLRNHPNDVQATHLLASAHLSQGRATRATALMKEAVKKRDMPPLQGLLGMSLVRDGKISEAVSALESAVARDPGQAQAGATLVSIYIQSGQADKAIRVAEAMAKDQPTSAQAHNVLGAARAAKGDNPGARAAFTKAMELDPAMSSVQVNLARLDLATGAADAAIVRLNSVLTKDPRSVEALSEMGRIHLRQRKFDDAQRWFEKADDHAGLDNLEPALTLVDMQLSLGRPEQAAEAAKRLVTKAPDAIPVLMAQARVFLANGNPASARTTLTRAATQANYNAPLLVQIAQMQVLSGHLPGAAYTLDKALSEQPGLLDAQVLMTEVEVRQGELQKAQQRARQITLSFPKRGVGHSLLAEVALARKETASAVESFRRAHQLDQTSKTLLRLHSVLASTDARAAQQLAEQWLKTRPRDVAVLRALADAQARNGNYAAAKRGYGEVLAITPSDAEVLNNLANVMILTKDPQALATAERALAARPEAPNIIGTAGWAAFHAGQNDRALQLLRDARLRDPTNPDTRYFLGKVLATVGRQGEARQELQAALATQRSFASAKDAQNLLETLK